MSWDCSRVALDWLWMKAFLRRRNGLLSSESNFWRAVANKIRCSGTVKTLQWSEKSRGWDFPLTATTILRHLLLRFAGHIERRQGRLLNNAGVNSFNHNNSRASSAFVTSTCRDRMHIYVSNCRWAWIPGAIRKFFIRRSCSYSDSKRGFVLFTPGLFHLYYETISFQNDDYVS